MVQVVTKQNRCGGPRGTRGTGQMVVPSSLTTVNPARLPQAQQYRANAEWSEGAAAVFLCSTSALQQVDCRWRPRRERWWASAARGWASVLTSG